MSITELTEKFTALMHEDFAQLGVALLRKSLK